MNIAEALKGRLAELHEEGARLRPNLAPEKPACRAWAVAALHAVEQACNHEGAYVKSFRALQEQCHQGLVMVSAVANMTELLGRLRKDMDDGLLSSVMNRVRAETYDDLLDHAAAYLQDGRKDPAGILAGVIFEDTIRRIARDAGVPEQGHSLEDLINALAKTPRLPGTKPKRAKAAAHVRTKATHAQWNEFDASDVEATIALTRELIDTNLS